MTSGLDDQPFHASAIGHVASPVAVAKLRGYVKPGGATANAIGLAIGEIATALGVGSGLASVFMGPPVVRGVRTAGAKRGTHELFDSDSPPTSSEDSARSSFVLLSGCPLSADRRSLR
jgi:hypothetical protein